jgi:hypothetical protein
MNGIRHQIITSEDGKAIGVILDIDTFKKMESIIEDHSLVHLMCQAEDDDLLNREDAIELYKSIISGGKNG